MTWSGPDKKPPTLPDDMQDILTKVRELSFLTFAKAHPNIQTLDQEVTISNTDTTNPVTITIPIRITKNNSIDFTIKTNGVPLSSVDWNNFNSEQRRNILHELISEIDEHRLITDIKLPDYIKLSNPESPSEQLMLTILANQFKRCKKDSEIRDEAKTNRDKVFGANILALGVSALLTGAAVGETAATMSTLGGISSTNPIAIAIGLAFGITVGTAVLLLKGLAARKELAGIFNKIIKILEKGEETEDEANLKKNLALINAFTGGLAFAAGAASTASYSMQIISSALGNVGIFLGLGVLAMGTAYASIKYAEKHMAELNKLLAKAIETAYYRRLEKLVAALALHTTPEESAELKQQLENLQDDSKDSDLNTLTKKLNYEVANSSPSSSSAWGLSAIKIQDLQRQIASRKSTLIQNCEKCIIGIAKKHQPTPNTPENTLLTALINKQENIENKATDKEFKKRIDKRLSSEDSELYTLNQKYNRTGAVKSGVNGFLHGLLFGFTIFASLVSLAVVTGLTFGAALVPALAIGCAVGAVFGINKAVTTWKNHKKDRDAILMEPNREDTSSFFADSTEIVTTTAALQSSPLTITGTSIETPLVAGGISVVSGAAAIAIPIIDNQHNKAKKAFYNGVKKERIVFESEMKALKQQPKSSQISTPILTPDNEFPPLDTSTLPQSPRPPGPVTGLSASEIQRQKEAPAGVTDRHTPPATPAG